MKRDGILILSYGGAHAQSLARRVRGGQVKGIHPRGFEPGDGFGSAAGQAAKQLEAVVLHGHLQKEESRRAD